MKKVFELSDIGYDQLCDSAIRKVIDAFKGGMGSGRFIIGGGVAARIHLVDHDVEPPAGEFVNIDLIAQSTHVIPAGILGAKGFWLAFKNFEFINIWDREYGISIRVFTTHIPPKEYTVWREIQGLGWVQIVDENWLFARMLMDLQRVLDPRKTPVDPKQFAMVKALLKIIDEQSVRIIWEAYFAVHTGYEKWQQLWDVVMPYENSSRVVVDPFNTGNGKKRLQKVLSVAKWFPYVLYKRARDGYL